MFNKEFINFFFKKVVDYLLSLRLLMSACQRTLQTLTEHSHSLNGILIILDKMSLVIKKGSGLCYLKIDLSRKNY
jgi:hypothetical protein